MYNVKPTAGELYYLRLLLCHVPGATGWDSFLQKAPREVGEPAPTSYRDAARAFGLLHDDSETMSMLHDALQLQTNVLKVHQLFAESLV